MAYLSQTNAPIQEALERMKRARLVPFDVPGHKRGRGNPELAAFLGASCLDVDVNSMKMLDNLCHPVSVIRDAEILAAETFRAAHAFFMVSGTTGSVQAMVLSAMGHGDKIIMPRNVHRSAINALILCGAIPIYVNPGIDDTLGIALGMRTEDVADAIAHHPEAKAVFVNNPTYYGICSDLRAITQLAHAHGMKVLVDEAHGTHLYFSDQLPVAAMDAGADMAAISMHKSGGSLTQSSILLCGSSMSAGYVHQIINITQTTSASYLLLASLDISRRNLALRGHDIVQKITDLVSYARNEINTIGDYYAYGLELIDGAAVYDFDTTKLSIFTRPTGLAGIEVYDILRDDYDIQTEFGDIANLLAYVSIGDRPKDIERLVAALAEIRRNYRKDPSKMLKMEYIDPMVVCGPQDAFYAAKEALPIADTVGRICSEFIMCYPPGIPILAPGEKITEEILTYIRYAKKKGCQITGPEDMSIRCLNVMTEK